MLNTKTLKRLAFITAVCAVPVIIIAFNAGRSAIKNKDALFLPGLLKNAEQISTVIIQDHEQTFTLSRSEGAWQLQERNNYPVMADRVENLLYSLADLRVVEPKTANPEYFSQIDVNDINEPNSNSVLITVRNDNNEDLVKLYVGKHEGVRLGEDYQENIFVRRANEDQTWLVQGVLSVTNDFKDWVDQPLLSLVDTDQIRKLEITRPHADTLVIAKGKQEQEDFALETAQIKKNTVLDVDTINSVPFEVAELEFEDVMPNSAELDWRNATQATISTFPGLQVVLDVVKKDSQVLAKVHATATADASVELKAKVEAYNKAKDAWVFKLPSDFYSTLSFNNSDFVKPKS